MVNPKSWHHQPFVLPPKVSGKLTELNLLISIFRWQIILPLLLRLSNSHISLRHKTQCLQNIHAKICKHYLHNYLFGFYVWTLLSTPSSWSCETLYGETSKGAELIYDLDSIILFSSWTLSAFSVNIHLPWILSAFSVNICISWMYPRSMDIISIFCIYPHFVDTIRILWILSALATLRYT